MCNTKCVNTSPRVFQLMFWRCILSTSDSASTVCSSKCVNTSSSCVVVSVLTRLPRVLQRMCWRCTWSTCVSASTACSTVSMACIPVTSSHIYETSSQSLQTDTSSTRLLRSAVVCFVTFTFTPFLISVM